MKNNLNITYVDIDDLKFSEYNPRKASKEQFEQLKKSIQKFGLVDPVLVNCNEKRKNIIIGGHFRVKVAKDLGIKQVPVVYIDIADIEKEKELNLRLNKNIGDWDWDLLANFSGDLLKDVGFDDLEKILNDNNEIIDKKENENIEVIEFTEKIIKFKSNNKYEIPELLPDKICKNIPDNLEVDIVNKEKATGNLVKFSRRNYYKGDKSKAIICFYEWDENFDSFWYKTKEIAEELYKDKWYSIITPNWSLFREDPIPLQLFNTFRSRYVGRYLQEIGFDVIPDVNFSDERSYDFCFLGIPENCKYISIQAQNLANKKDFKYFCKGFEKALEIIKPGNVIIYTGSEKVKRYVSMKNINCIFVNSFTNKQKEVMKK